MRGRLLKGVRSFYNTSRACVRVKRSLTEFFEVEVGLRQGCVMSPWLFNVFLDSVIRSMNRVDKGASLIMHEERWEVSMLLFADDAVLVAESRERLEDLVRKFERESRGKGLKINPSKSRVCELRILRMK